MFSNQVSSGLKRPQPSHSDVDESASLSSLSKKPKSDAELVLFSPSHSLAAGSADEQNPIPAAKSSKSNEMPSHNPNPPISSSLAHSSQAEVFPNPQPAQPALNPDMSRPQGSLEFDQGMQFLGAKQYRMAVNSFKNAVRFGHAQAHFQLGLCFMGDKKPLRRTPKLVDKWFQKAKKYGVQIPPDLEKWCQQATEESAKKAKKKQLRSLQKYGGSFVNGVYSIPVQSPPAAQQIKVYRPIQSAHAGLSSVPGVAPPHVIAESSAQRAPSVLPPPPYMPPAFQVNPSQPVQSASAGASSAQSVASGHAVVASSAPRAAHAHVLAGSSVQSEPSVLPPPPYMPPAFQVNPSQPVQSASAGASSAPRAAAPGHSLLPASAAFQRAPTSLGSLMQSVPLDLAYVNLVSAGLDAQLVKEALDLTKRQLSTI